MENLNGKELIQELLYGISNKQLPQQIEYKNTLMAAQLAQDVALVILRYILSYSRTRKFKILDLFHPNLACIKREQWVNVCPLLQLIKFETAFSVQYWASILSKSSDLKKLA